MKANEREKLAWAAGLFDGEGCIHIRQNGHSVVLSLAMTHRPTIEQLGEILGYPWTLATLPPAQPHYKEQYRWSLRRQPEVLDCLSRLEPYIVTRREKLQFAKTIIKEYALKRATQKRIDRLVADAKLSNWIKSIV